MDILTSTSLIVAFIAGVAALFAPCCITVLLPAYLGSIFREKYQVFLMTFIFFLGVAAVFLPIGLGVASAAKFFREYHNFIFAGGGILLLGLGIMLLTGIRFSLPFQIHPSLKKHNAISVFFLGILSAIATTCCAPVLAGVLALAAMPGSIFWGGMYTLSYVLGMVAPLFIIAFALDKTDFTKKFMAFRKSFSYTLGGKTITIMVSELISGITFTAMGAVTAYLAFTNNLFSHSSYQTSVNITLTQFLTRIQDVIAAVPEWVIAVIVIAAVALIIKFSIQQFKKERL